MFYFRTLYTTPRLPLPEGRAGRAWWTSACAFRHTLLSHVAPCLYRRTVLPFGTPWRWRQQVISISWYLLPDHTVSRPRILFSQHHTCQQREKSRRQAWHCHQFTGETRKRILTNILRDGALHHRRFLPMFRRNAVSIFREPKLRHTSRGRYVSLKRRYISAGLHG